MSWPGDTRPQLQRLVGKIISSLARWLLITMMIMVILTRDLACCADSQCGVVTIASGLLHLARPRSAVFGDLKPGVSPGYRKR